MRLGRWAYLYGYRSRHRRRDDDADRRCSEDRYCDVHRDSAARSVTVIEVVRAGAHVAPAATTCVRHAKCFPSAPFLIHSNEHRKFLVCIASDKLFHSAAAPFQVSQSARLLIVYHACISYWPSVAPSGSQPVVLTAGEFHSSAVVLRKEISARYSGHFVIGQDLDVY